MVMGEAPLLSNTLTSIEQSPSPLHQPGVLLGFILPKFELATQNSWRSNYEVISSNQTFNYYDDRQKDSSCFFFFRGLGDGTGA
jgi:hypothetical protein